MFCPIFNRTNQKDLQFHCRLIFFVKVLQQKLVIRKERRKNVLNFKQLFLH